MAQRHGPGSVRLWRTRHHGSVRGIPWPEKGSAPAAQEANMEGENVQGNYVYWLVASTPLKNDGVRTSWDDYFQYIWKIENVPNHQPGLYILFECLWAFIFFLELSGITSFYDRFLFVGSI